MKKKNNVVVYSNIHDKFVSSNLTCKLKIYTISGHKNIDIIHFFNRQSCTAGQEQPPLAELAADSGRTRLEPMAGGW